MIITDDIKNAILARHKDKNEWVVLFELGMQTGYELGVAHGETLLDRKIDAMAFNCYPSKGLERIAYEIKLSRSDFRNELLHPQKRFLAMLYSTHYHFVAPEGVINPRDVPFDCGLMTMDKPGGTLKVVRSGRELPLHPVSNGFLAAAVRNAYKDGRDTKRVSLNTELLKDKEKC